MKELKEIQSQLVEYLEKAYTLTASALKKVQENELEDLVTILDNRERSLNIITSLSEKLSLYKNVDAPEELIEFNNQVNLIIDKIVNMDDIITTCLQYEKEKTQIEIAKTYKNKENFKGYNLNNTK